MSNNKQDTIQAYLDKGYALIPIDKDKRSYNGLEWAKIRDGITPKITDVNTLLKGNGVGLLMGNPNGVNPYFIECIDIDSKNDKEDNGEVKKGVQSINHRYTDKIKTERPELYKKLTIEQTQSGGLHLIYSLPSGVNFTSEKLAYCKNGNGVIIETISELKYLAVYPSERYNIIHNNGNTIANLKEITLEEREYLIATAKGFNEVENYTQSNAVSFKSKSFNTSNEGLSPIDWFNYTYDIRDILESRGIDKVREDNQWEYYKHPEGTNEYQYKVRKESGDLIAWSDREGLESGKFYPPFNLYALWMHNNNGDTAISEVLDMQEYKEYKAQFNKTAPKNNTDITPQITQDDTDSLWAEINKPYGFSELRKALNEIPETFQTEFIIGQKKNGENKYLEIPTNGITTICAVTGHGKTTMLLNLAIQAVIKGKKVLYISYEQPPEDLYPIAISIYLDAYLDPDNKEENRDLIARYIQNEESVNISDDLKTKIKEFELEKMDNLLIRDFKREITSEKLSLFLSDSKNHLGDDGIVLVDYIQNLTSNAKSNARHEEIQSFMESLYEVVKEKKFPFISAAQFNRQVTTYEDIHLSNVGEGGYIGLKSTLVLGMWNNSFKPAKDKKPNQNEKSVNISHWYSTPTWNRYNKGEGGLYIKILKGRKLPPNGEYIYEFEGAKGKIYPDKVKMIEDNELTPINTQIIPEKFYYVTNDLKIKGANSKTFEGAFKDYTKFNSQDKHKGDYIIKPLKQRILIESEYHYIHELEITQIEQYSQYKKEKKSDGSINLVPKPTIKKNPEEPTIKL